jgi:Ras family protein T1
MTYIIEHLSEWWYCTVLFFLPQKYFVDSKIPILIVANKSDLEETRQDYLLQPAAFCSHHKLSPPHPFTASGTIRRDLYVKLSTMAAFPWVPRINCIYMKAVELLQGVSYGRVL